MYLPVITRVGALWVAVVLGAWAFSACDAGPADGGTATPTAGPSSTPPRSDEASGLSFKDFDDDSPVGGGPSNVVSVRNEQDGRFRFRSNVDLARINGKQVRPVNAARAEASCTDCQTIAVAVQVAVYRRGAEVVTPSNEAVSLNLRCTRCVTVTRAIQYVIPVDDPREVPRDVDALVKDINRELRYFEGIKDVREVNVQEAEARINSVLAKYASLQQYVRDLRDEKTEGGTPTPTPSATGTASVTPTATETTTASSTATATATLRAATVTATETAVTNSATPAATAR